MFQTDSHTFSLPCHLRAPSQAVRTGHDAVKSMCAAIEGWAVTVGKPKRTDDLVLPPPGLDEAVQEMAGAEVRVGGGLCALVWFNVWAGCASSGKGCGHMMHVS